MKSAMMTKLYSTIQMTKPEALAALDRLDKYWDQPREVDQSIGVACRPVDDGNLCGCFGVHCDFAITPKNDCSNPYYYFESGASQLAVISKTLGVRYTGLCKILREYSNQPDSFGHTDWAIHPNQAWPKISARLRERATSGSAGCDC